MPPVEITSLRGRFHKVYDLGGGLRQIVVGGAIAHHQVSNEWVETDCNWVDLTDRFGVGQYPFTVALNKASRTLSVTYEGATVTLTPTNTQNPSITRSGNMVTLAGLWRGITLRLYLTPNGVKAEYIRTSDNYVNPSYTYTGDLAAWTHQPYYHASNPVTPIRSVVLVPQTMDAGVYTLDMGSVPLDVVVDPSITPNPYGAGEGRVAFGASTYEGVRGATSGTYVSTSETTAAIYSEYWWDPELEEEGYDLSRYFCPFDTSAIPDSATISSASLRIRVSNVTYDGTLVVVSSGQASATSLELADYDMRGSTSFGSQTISTTGEYNISLNSSGLAAISKTGYTKLAIISDDDFGGYYYADVNISIFTQEYTTASYRPMLTVNYTDDGITITPATESPKLSDTASIVLGAVLKSLTETATLTDGTPVIELTTDAVEDINRSVEELPKLSDTASIALSEVLKTLGDSAQLSDSLTILLSELRKSVVENATINDTALIALSEVIKVVSENPTVSDTVAVHIGDVMQVVSDSMTLADVIGVQLSAVLISIDPGNPAYSLSGLKVVTG